MKQTLSLVTALLAAVVFNSCSKMGPLTADNFTVTPSPLEVSAGKIPVTIYGKFPQKYMKKKAVVTVTPVLRYKEGLAPGQSAVFQGEKVEANNQTISYRLGGNYTMKSTFNYLPAMNKSELYLTFDAKKGKKTVKIPDVKIADGVLATAALQARTLNTTQPAFAPDAYEHVVAQKQQATIQFLIQHANIRSSELKAASITEFTKTLKAIRADQERMALNNIEVSAYASPDGGQSLNEKLAIERQKTSSKFVSGQLKQTGVETYVDTKYTAQDWEGFQELVSKSNIQDKEIILRVLSLYEDPQERERQIKNISVAFRELADEILPQLRRARLSINYELIGRSDDEILSLLSKDPTALSIEEILYAATLINDVKEKDLTYKKAINKYRKDYRAFNNLAALAYEQGNYDEAANALKAAIAVDPNAAETNLNMGLVALRSGSVEEATTYISKGSGSPYANEILGELYLAEGNDAQAARSFAGIKSNSAALAHLLNKDYAAATTALSGLAHPDATTSYLKALVAMRTKDSNAALSHLKEAIAADPSLRKYASTDLEFSSLFNNRDFQALTH